MVNYCEKSGTPINKLQPPELQEGERELQILACKFLGLLVGLHWVMKRPDGSYMDPGVGKNSLNFKLLNKNMQSESNRFISYSDTGIAIRIKSPENLISPQVPNKMHINSHLNLR